jgi:mRNA-degrading endonuclease toxin of MazEF toxin-antitoxin module
MNGKNVPQPGDVVLLIGNVPAGGGEVRPALILQNKMIRSKVESNAAK